jgi:phosphorylcholine metabolism protein LicD
MFQDPKVDTNRKKWTRIVKKHKLNNDRFINPKDRIIYPGMELISYKKPLFSYDDIFPLVRSDFEKSKVNTPNNNTKFLRAFYGDYYSFPKGGYWGIHSNEIDLADENLNKVLEKTITEKKIVLD